MRLEKPDRLSWLPTCSPVAGRKCCSYFDTGCRKPCPSASGPIRTDPRSRQCLSSAPSALFLVRMVGCHRSISAYELSQEVRMSLRKRLDSLPEVKALAVNPGHDQSALIHAGDNIQQIWSVAFTAQVRPRRFRQRGKEC